MILIENGRKRKVKINIEKFNSFMNIIMKRKKLYDNLK
jgi:hypothetical protein